MCLWRRQTCWQSKFLCFWRRHVCFCSKRVCWRAGFEFKTVKRPGSTKLIVFAPKNRLAITRRARTIVQAERGFFFLNLENAVQLRIDTDTKDWHETPDSPRRQSDTPPKIRVYPRFMILRRFFAVDGE